VERQECTFDSNFSRRLAGCAFAVWLGLSAATPAQVPAQATPAAPAKRLTGVQTKASQAAMSPEKALELLKAGNARFVAGKTTHRNLPANVRATAAGQYPFGAIVSCMDSRVPVELVFDLTVGDAFSLRVAGNVINPDILGSLEYATKVAGAKLILVLGHTHCGAVKGAIDGVQLGNLTGILARIVPPAATGPAPGSSGGATGSSKDNAYVDQVTEQNVRNAMKEIRGKSSVLKELLDTGAVRLVGGIYDVETGKATFYED
jgi:carbonic anhydrase